MSVSLIVLLMFVAFLFYAVFVSTGKKDTGSSGITAQNNQLKSSVPTGSKAPASSTQTGSPAGSRVAGGATVVQGTSVRSTLGRSSAVRPAQGPQGRVSDSRSSQGGSQSTHGDSQWSWGTFQANYAARQSSFTRPPAFVPGSSDHWVCPYCESFNATERSSCMVCGNDR